LHNQREKTIVRTDECRNETKKILEF